MPLGTAVSHHALMVSVGYLQNLHVVCRTNALEHVRLCLQAPSYEGASGTGEASKLFCQPPSSAGGRSNQGVRPKGRRIERCDKDYFGRSSGTCSTAIRSRVRDAPTVAESGNGESALFLSARKL